MMIAVSVYATHKLWREEVISTDTSGGKLGGLNMRLKAQIEMNKQALQVLLICLGWIVFFQKETKKE